MPATNKLYTNRGQTYVVDAEPFAYGRTSFFHRATAPNGLTVCAKLFRRLEDISPRTDEFLRELEARHLLNHPNVLPVLDYGVQEANPPRPFIIIPYCRGGDLRTLLEHRSLLPVHEALTVLRPLASAIDFAHDAGVIHGDIKPENVLFGGSATEVFLADFGAARFVVVRERVSGWPPQRRPAGPGYLPPEGTELYLSPEELETGAQSPLSDIYSLSFVSYELLTGVLPLDPKGSSYRRMQAKIEGNLMDPVKANPKLSKHVRNALLTGLSVDPANRPSSATMLCEMLAGSTPVPSPLVSRAPIEVFLSYAHEDEVLRVELTKHLSILQRQGLIAGWHDRCIAAGAEWAGQIDDHLERASVVLLLVSADFMASDYCYDVEMKRALERHERREATVIPVILRPVPWSDAPFAKLQSLPTDAKPVTTWSNRDEAFLNIAEALRAVVKGVNAPRAM